jgi:transcriptional regulator with XRE-family HTH domain
MSDKTSSNLASNLKRLRETRELTQAELAARSGVPRPTVAHLETGGANPTLSVLTKVADTLQVPIEKLIASPEEGQLHLVGTLSSRTRGRVLIRELLPERTAGLSFERLEFPSGTRLSCRAGPVGTRQYVTCESGELELTSGGETWHLNCGDLLALRAEHGHVLSNRGRRKAVAYSLLALAPLGS